MVDYHEQVDFDKTVWTVEDGVPRPCSLGDLCAEWAETVPTPEGVRPVIHARGRELWSWRDGQHPILVETFGSPAAARHAAMLAWLHDLDQRGPEYYWSRAESETDD